MSKTIDPTALDRKGLYDWLQNFDWSYQYSDDSRVWRTWSRLHGQAQTVLDSMNFQWSWRQLERTMTGQILELYKQDHDGTYYQEEWRTHGWKMYQPTASELVTQEIADQIINWFTNLNPSTDTSVGKTKYLTAQN